ncbi:MAG: hypothetical protein DRJ01_19340 [Bacteroidetes bacterium]|nr:MAG: hypothetical protein DRJ01_19340 [Bacteroidota bacterium]
MKTNLLMILVMTLSSQLLSQQGWQYQNSDLYSNQYGDICALNKDTVFIIANEGVFLKTYDGGTNWIEQNTGFLESFYDLSFIDNDTGYAVGQNGTIIKTIDGGLIWTSQSSGIDKDIFSIFINSPNNIWAVGDSGVILNSSNFGNNWTLNNSLSNKRLNSIQFKNNDIGFIVGNNGTLFSTLNGGNTWDNINIETTKDLFSITITDNYVYLLAGWVDDNYYDCDEFFKTNDNINWVSHYIEGGSDLYFQNDSLGFYLSSGCTTNGDCVIGINKTTDFGETWEKSLYDWNPPYMPGLGYSSIEFVTDSIGYVLCGDIILKTTDGGIFVSIKELNSSPHFTIYPNPSYSDKLNIKLLNTDFNGLSIKMFDIKGKIIFEKTDLNSLENINISNLNAGVYFVKLLKEDKIIDVKKLMKIK